MSAKDDTFREIADAYDDFPISLVLTDPRLEDNPIVYVNKAFTELTGYTAAASCGRNCRFLQGADTDPTPVRELAEAVRAEEPAAVEIVNYTSWGERFVNHLVVTPITEDGETIFFIGMQAGWRESGRPLGSAERLTQHLAELEKIVTDQVGNLLRIMRREITDPRDSRDVAKLLASRIDCLAQLYDGVFRRYSRGFDGEVRLGAYLARVCSSTHTADRSFNVRMSTDFIEASVDADTAATVGLCMSEILANAFLDINPYDEGAEIFVTLEWCEVEHARLSIRTRSNGDNGSLMPRPDTVGSRILLELLPRLGVVVRESYREDIRELVIPLPMLRDTGRFIA